MLSWETVYENELAKGSTRLNALNKARRQQLSLIKITQRDINDFKSDVDLTNSVPENEREDGDEAFSMIEMIEIEKLERNLEWQKEELHKIDKKIEKEKNLLRQLLK